MNVAHSFSVSWLSNFRQSESPFFGFWYSEDFARFVERFVDEVSNVYFSDHVLPDRAPGMQDSQTLRRTQTGLGLGGSVEGIQGRLTEEKELQFLREQLTTYIEAIRPKNPKSKLFQKKIDTNEPMESASDLLQYAEQLQVIHKSIPTSPKDRLLLKWTDNPVVFDGREPPSPPVPTRESTLEKFKTMDTLVERMMGTLSIKIHPSKESAPGPEPLKQIRYRRFPRFPNLRQGAHWRKELPQFPHARNIV
ncbi:hypothetical protein H4Q26_002206 [Puccinia striiformis f. sp. tritici PST-130]|nr:hypothetical protein H4Q26_002206 [Puccinia striiformis f. sp. tritici PST-130]